MRFGTIIWVAILALCLGATVHEMPNAVCNVRFTRNIFLHPEDHVTLAVPDRLVAADPEAGDILRYCLKDRHSHPDLVELRALVAKYPQNEFFSSLLAERLAEANYANTEEVLALISKLRTIDPNNAHYAYLRGWVLLKTLDAGQRVPEALREFEIGDRLPELYLPYRKYKPRVDALAEKAVLSRFGRPWIRPFYSSLGGSIAASAHGKGVDEGQFRRLIAAGERMADRLITTAYDIDSLQAAGRLLQEIEEAKLKELDLPAGAAQEARQRISQAIAIDKLGSESLSARPLDRLTHPNVMLWIILFLSLFKVLGARRQRRREQAETAPRLDDKSYPIMLGIIMLSGLLTIVTLHCLHPNWFLPTALYFGAWFLWVDYPSELTRTNMDSRTGRRSIWLRPAAAFVLLWVNGALFVLIGDARFMVLGQFTGWQQSLGTLVFWLVFCLLLWISTQDRQPFLGRISHIVLTATVFYWMVILAGLDISGAQWRYESHVYADPLSLYGPIPKANQETYERIVLSGKPPSYRRNDPLALPEHIEFAAPQYMKAFLARRQSEGKPLSREQLQDLLGRAGRDVRPILLDAINDRNHAKDSTHQNTNRSAFLL